MAIPERTVLPAHREYLTAGLSGRVLDLGAGTGAMFPYFASRPDIELCAVEPDPAMRRQARSKAADLDLTVDIADARAEALPYDDDSFDAVVASFVFCTIPDPGAALGELARVLRPGGEFRFLEHVRADGVAGRLHDLFAPAWHTVAGGCHLNRETGDLFRTDDRFAIVEYRRLSDGAIPMIRGTLERRSGGRLRDLLARL
jgi:ubiquinone/menaquinone biosynthesis C-methylase UbiE